MYGYLVAALGLLGLVIWYLFDITRQKPLPDWMEFLIPGGLVCFVVGIVMIAFG